MKKHLFISFLLMSVFAYSQSMDIKLGLTHSYQFAKYDGKTMDYDYILNPGILGGLNFNSPINDNWKFSVGLFLESNGYANKIRLTNTEGEFEYFRLYHKVFYVKTPVLIKKDYKINDNISIYGGLGPYVGVKVYACTITDSRDCDNGAYIDGRTKDFDFGLQVESGILIKHKYSCSLSYEYGLLNIEKPVMMPLNIGKSSNRTIKRFNRVLSLSFGYRFDLRRY